MNKTKRLSILESTSRIKGGNRLVITKEMIIDTMNLCKFVDENGFGGMLLLNHPENQQKFQSVLKPEFNRFINTHKKTPNIILKDFLKRYLKKRNLESEFTAEDFNFVGLKIHTFTWACIRTNNMEGLKKGQPRAMQLPQLYITIFDTAIRFGFAFGNMVKDENRHVTIFRELPNHNQILEELIKKDPEIVFEDDKNWSNNIRIIKTYSEMDIDDTIEEKITETFDNLLEVFKITSVPSPEGTNPPTPPPPEINYWQIILGEDATKWDEWKKNNIIDIGFKELIQSAGERILEMSENEIKKLYNDAYSEKSNPDEEIDKIINFLQNMKEGDYVRILTNQGGSVLGRGIIKSGPIYGYSQEFPVCRQIEWKNTAIQKPVSDDGEE